MAFAVTGFKAFGVEGEQPLSSECYLQYLSLNVTSLAADVDMDIGDHLAASLGVFWTAADDTPVGLRALATLRQIVGRSASLFLYGGLLGKAVTTVAVENLAPNIAFTAATGPVLATVTICWTLQTGVAPIYLVG